MTYEKKLYTRTIKQARTIVEIWTSTAGSLHYVERDGKKLLVMQPQETAHDVVEQFRELSPMEKAIFESKMPELWKGDET